MRLMLSTLHYDTSSYRECVLAGHLELLAQHVAALRARALDATERGGEGGARMLEPAVLRLIDACAAFEGDRPAEAEALLAALAALAAVTSEACARAACEALALHALPWHALAPLWRAYPPALVRVLNDAGDELAGRPGVAFPRQQGCERLGEVCDAARADGAIAAAALAACRAAHRAASSRGTGADADAARALALSVAIHAALAEPATGGGGPRRACVGAAPGVACRIRVAYADDRGWPLQPLLARLALQPTEQALVELALELARAAAPRGGGARGHGRRAHERNALDQLGDGDEEEEEEPLHDLWFALASRPCWQALALRLVARGSARSSQPLPRGADGAGAALDMLAWCAHPREADAPRRQRLGFELGACAAALRAEGDEQPAAGRRLLALVEHGAAAPGAAAVAAAAAGPRHSAEAAHARSWRARLGFAHALVRAEGDGGRALRALVAASREADRARAGSACASLRAEGALARALADGAADVAAGALSASVVPALLEEVRLLAAATRELGGTDAARSDAQGARVAAQLAESAALLDELLLRLRPDLAPTTGQADGL
jgi:hypothetical protein